MIKSFRDKATATVFEGRRSRKLPPQIQPRGFRRAAHAGRAVDLEDLKIPPGNRLESPRGNRAGQWSIWIDEQWRIWFCWNRGHAFDVEITDYH